MLHAKQHQFLFRMTDFSFVDVLRVFIVTRRLTQESALLQCRPCARQSVLELQTAAVAKHSVAMAITVTAPLAEKSAQLLSCHHSINFCRFLLFTQTSSIRLCRLSL